MIDEQDLNARRTRMMEICHEYGQTFNAFVPVEQPDPHDWDLPLEIPDKKGTYDPQALKYWRYFERTRDFLRHRYADHGILAGPALVFDCLVPKFQKPLEIPPEKRRQHKLPRKGDPPEW